MKQPKVNTVIPIVFEKTSEFAVDDVRFQKVKIWLMHLGENLNGSYFDKDSVVKALPTLANTPILGYIEDNKDGEKDFSNHRKQLTREDGKWLFKYAGQAYGVIPETNNAQFEWRMCDDGVEREFLTCEGLVWTKWDDPIDILDRDSTKSQSMELHQDFEGYFDDKDKLFHFTDFKFFGACFLGVDYKPGMNNATIERMGEFESVDFEELKRRIEMFNEFQAQRQNSNMTQEGGNDVDKKLELLTKFGLTREAVEAMGIDFEAIDLDALEAKLNEFAAQQAEQKAAESKDDGGEEGAPTGKEPASGGEENPDGNDPNTNFALTSNQMTREINRALNPNPPTDEWGWPIYEYWYMDHTEDTVIAYRESDWRLVGLNYTMEGDKPVIDFGSVKPYKAVYMPMDGFAGDKANIVPVEYLEHAKKVAAKVAEKEFSSAQEEALATANAKIESLESENESLKTKVSEFESKEAERLAAERKEAEREIFESPEFAVLSEEEINSVRKNASQFSLDDIKVQLFALVGMKASKTNFSANPAKKSGLKVGIDNGIAPKNEPEWAHIVRNYKTEK